MLRAKRIIAFSPHPDDSELVAGGFLSLAVQRKRKVKLVVVSDGSRGFYSRKSDGNIVEIRRNEQFNACRIIGIKDVRFLGYQDSRVPEPHSLREKFMRIIRKYGPDLVITVDPLLEYESHPDHVNVGKAVLQAVLFHGLPGMLSSVRTNSPPPSVALGATNHPNVVICIDKYVSKKLGAIRAHQSQFSDLEISRLASNCKQVESFRLLYSHELHMSA